MNTKDFWYDIERLNWFGTAYEENHNQLIADRLLSWYPNTSQITDIMNFVVDKRKVLVDIINKWIEETNFEDLAQWDFEYWESNRVWDLASHIVGLGRAMYYQVLTNPQIVLTFSNRDAVENFEYGFDSAIYTKRNCDMYDEDCNGRVCAFCYKGRDFNKFEYINNLGLSQELTDELLKD